MYCFCCSISLISPLLMLRKSKAESCQIHLKCTFNKTGNVLTGQQRTWMQIGESLRCKTAVCVCVCVCVKCVRLTLSAADRGKRSVAPPAGSSSARARWVAEADWPWLSSLAASSPSDSPQTQTHSHDKNTLNSSGNRGRAKQKCLHLKKNEVEPELFCYYFPPLTFAMLLV